MRMRGRPSPAMIVAVVALIAALGGTAVAGELVTGKKAKKISKKIANKQINKRASGLTVGNANKLGNQVPGAFQTTAASDRRSDSVALTGANVPYLSTSITLPAPKTVTANAVLEGQGTGGNDNMNCFIRIGGNDGVNVATGLAPSIVNDTASLAVTHAAPLGPGTHAVEVLCNQGVGSVTTLSDRALTAVATG